MEVSGKSNARSAGRRSIWWWTRRVEPAVHNGLRGVLPTFEVFAECEPGEILSLDVAGN